MRAFKLYSFPCFSSTCQPAPSATLTLYAGENKFQMYILLRRFRERRKSEKHACQPPPHSLFSRRRYYNVISCAPRVLSLVSRIIASSTIRTLKLVANGNGKSATRIIRQWYRDVIIGRLTALRLSDNPGDVRAALPTKGPPRESIHCGYINQNGHVSCRGLMETVTSR